jgi:hypothetical protein
MGDLKTRDPSNVRALHKAADFANSVRAFVQQSCGKSINKGLRCA